MRKILLVIDMQNDFITGPLGSPAAAAVVPKVLRKIDHYAPSDIYVTLDTHGNDYLDTCEGEKLPVVHCVRDTDGWKLQDEIAARLTEAHIIEKSTFGSYSLAQLLREENETEALEIEIVGLCTDICVVSNALLIKAMMPDIKISVDSACCAGVTPESHAAALLTMKMCQIDIFSEEISMLYGVNCQE